MSFTAITDHLTRALSRVRLQFRQSTDIAGVLAALAREVQEFENAASTVIAQFRSINTATADLLVQLGSMVGAPTIGVLTDSEYKLIVNGQVIVNKAQCRVQDLIDLAAATLTGHFWNSPAQILESETDQSLAFGIYGGRSCAVVCEKDSGTVVNLAEYFARAVAPLFFQMAPAGGRVIFCYVPEYDPGADPGDGVMRADLSSCDQKFTPLAALDRA